MISRVDIVFLHQRYLSLHYVREILYWLTCIRSEKHEKKEKKKNYQCTVGEL